MHRGTEAGRCGDAEKAIPYPGVVDKNWEGYLASERSQTKARPHSLGFQ